MWHFCIMETTQQQKETTDIHINMDISEKHNVELKKSNLQNGSYDI